MKKVVVEEGCGGTLGEPLGEPWRNQRAVCGLALEQVSEERGREGGLQGNLWGTLGESVGCSLGWLWSGSMKKVAGEEGSGGTLGEPWGNQWAALWAGFEAGQ